MDESFLDPFSIQQNGLNQTMGDAFAFPNAEVIENMIYEPGNIDWVGP